MAIQFNSFAEGVKSIIFDDGTVNKIVYGVVLDDGHSEKYIWGRRRTLQLNIGSNVIFNSVKVYCRTIGYEPTQTIGELTPTLRSPGTGVYQFDVYFGDRLEIYAEPVSGYQTSGTGIYIVAGGTSTINRNITATATQVYVTGSLDNTGSTIRERVLINNQTNSTVYVISIQGTLVIQEGAVSLTILAGNTGTLSDTRSGVPIIRDDYPVTIGLSDGSYIDGTITNNL